MNNEQAMVNSLNNFSQRKMIVVGDVILDHFTFCNISRVNPEQPASPLLEVVEDKFTLGGAANVAANIASLGAHVILMGMIGDDQHGILFKDECRKLGIDFVSIRDG